LQKSHTNTSQTLHIKKLIQEYASSFQHIKIKSEENNMNFKRIKYCLSHGVIGQLIKLLNPPHTSTSASWSWQMARTNKKWSSII